MFSTVSIATLFLINAYSFYSITAEEANIGNIPASNDKMPRSAQIPSELGMETNSTIKNKTPSNAKMQKDLARDGKALQSKVKTKKNLTSGNNLPNNEEKQPNLKSDDKTPRSDKMPSEMETNLTIENKIPNDDQMPKHLTSDGKVPRSGKVQSERGMETNLTIGNKTPSNDKMQKDLARDGKTSRSDKMSNKDITQSGNKTETNLPNENNLPNNDKMLNDDTELLDEFKALLKSDKYKTKGANVLVDWVLEKECKSSENMNKNSEKLEVTDGKNNAELEKFYEIYSKICAENGDKKVILTKYREELTTQMKDILGTQILAQMKEFEEILKRNDPNATQYMANDFKAFLDEMPETEGKSAIIAPLASNPSSPILPSELIEPLLITKPTTNSKNLETPIVHRRHARNGFKLSDREMNAIKKTLCDIRVILTLATLYFWYYEHNFILVLIIWFLIWFEVKLVRRIR